MRDRGLSRKLVKEMMLRRAYQSEWLKLLQWFWMPSIPFISFFISSVRITRVEENERKTLHYFEFFLSCVCSSFALTDVMVEKEWKRHPKNNPNPLSWTHPKNSRNLHIIPLPLCTVYSNAKIEWAIGTACYSFLNVDSNRRKVTSVISPIHNWSAALSCPLTISTSMSYWNSAEGKNEEFLQLYMRSCDLVLCLLIFSYFVVFMSSLLLKFVCFPIWRFSFYKIQHLVQKITLHK